MSGVEFLLNRTHFHYNLDGKLYFEFDKSVIIGSGPPVWTAKHSR